MTFSIGRLRLVKTLSVTDLVDRLGIIATIKEHLCSPVIRVLLLQNYTPTISVWDYTINYIVRSFGETKNKNKKKTFFFKTFVLHIIFAVDQKKKTNVVVYKKRASSLT